MNFFELEFYFFTFKFELQLYILFATSTQIHFNSRIDLAFNIHYQSLLKTKNGNYCKGNNNNYIIVHIKGW